MPSEPAWRVVVEIGDPIPFHTERGARTAAAIRSRDGRRPAAVEHLDGDGWHPCPGGECIPDRDATAADRGTAAALGLSAYPTPDDRRRASISAGRRAEIARRAASHPDRSRS